MIFLRNFTHTGQGANFPKFQSFSFLLASLDLETFTWMISHNTFQVSNFFMHEGLVVAGLQMLWL